MLFRGCANGWIGYLPTPGEHEAGGYEVELAPVVYEHLSGWLTPALPETAGVVVEDTVQLISGTIDKN